MKNYYKILQIDNFSDQKTIKAAYLRLAKKYHPDLNKGQYFYNDYFSEIKNAYDFLISSENKKEYDILLRSNPDLFNNVEIIKQHESDKIVNIKKKYAIYNYIMMFLFLVFLAFFVAYVNAYFENKSLSKKIEGDSISKLTLRKDIELLIEKNAQIYNELNNVRDSYMVLKSLINKPKQTTVSNTIKGYNEKIDYCSNMYPLTGSYGTYIVNNNKVIIDKVTVVIWAPVSSGYGPTEESHIDIRPGKNLIGTGLPPGYFMTIKSCVKY